MFVIAKAVYSVRCALLRLSLPACKERGATTAEYVGTILLGLAFVAAVINLVTGGSFNGVLSAFINQAINLAQQKLK